MLFEPKKPKKTICLAELTSNHLIAFRYKGNVFTLNKITHSSYCPRPWYGFMMVGSLNHNPSFLTNSFEDTIIKAHTHGLTIYVFESKKELFKAISNGTI